MQIKLKKQRLFRLISVAITAALILIPVGLFYIYFRNNYDVMIYKKELPEYTKSLRNAKIVDQDVNYQTPETKKLEDPGEVTHKHNLGYEPPPDSFDERMPHPYAGYKPQPGVEVILPGDALGDQHIVINGLGHRSPQLGAKDKLRIAIIGGSTAFNGPSNDETIIGELARLLDADYINAAVVSSISNQEFSIFANELLDMDIDVLVSFDGYNDIHHVLLYNGRVGWPPFRWNDIYYPAIPRAIDTGSISKETMDNTLGNYLGNVEKVARICREYNISYIAVLQPWKDFDPARCQMERISATEYFYCYVTASFNEWDSARRYGASYVSFSDLVPASLYGDQVHFSIEGNRITAEQLFRMIKERKLA